MDELIAGYRRFRSGWASRGTLPPPGMDAAQAPRALVIACSDSRVDPQMIFDAGPGDLFVVRNVAALVPPYKEDRSDLHGTSAALEFGVRALQVKHIIVMGHAGCGGVNFLLGGSTAPVSDFVPQWMNIVAGAKARALAHGHLLTDRQRFCEHECIRESLGNLYTFPWIRDRVEDGSLILHGTWFDLHTAGLWELKPDGVFAEL
ncbi:carbonic anhydrase [Zavarzinia sp. CC-PAN008]|uniref:carbonic anhydrase n=1 Tax=Zavarzinia sp. CC-PAN008 TaxID=3243332 RepID=UPI003F7449D6